MTLGQKQYKQNRSYYLAKSKEYDKNNPEKAKLRKTKHNLKKRYNITLDEYKNMVCNQRGCCALCHKPFDNKTKMLKAAIDHNHKTGKVRALLHHSCNLLLGFVEDKMELLDRIPLYLSTTTTTTLQDN